MFVPKQTVILNKAPKFNTFYRPDKTRSVVLSQVARVAAKNAGLPTNKTFSVIKAISNSQWNEDHIDYTHRGYENYGDDFEGPSYSKRYSLNPIAESGTGKNYPVLWIPDPRNPKEPGPQKVVVKPPVIERPIVDDEEDPVRVTIPTVQEPDKPPITIILEPITDAGDKIISEIITDPDTGEQIGPGVTVITDPEEGTGTIEVLRDPDTDEIEIIDAGPERPTRPTRPPGKVQVVKDPATGEIELVATRPDGQKVVVQGPSKEQMKAYQRKFKRWANRYIDKRIDLKMKQYKRPGRPERPGKRPERPDKPVTQNSDMSWAAIPFFSLVALL